MEDLTRYGIVTPGVATPRKRGVAVESAGERHDALATGYAKLATEHGSCKAIRMLAHKYSDVPVRTFIASLPNVAQSTIRIQFAKGRKGQV